MLRDPLRVSVNDNCHKLQRASFRDLGSEKYSSRPCLLAEPGGRCFSRAWTARSHCYLQLGDLFGTEPRELGGLQPRFCRAVQWCFSRVCAVCLLLPGKEPTARWAEGLAAPGAAAGRSAAWRHSNSRCTVTLSRSRNFYAVMRELSGILDAPSSYSVWHTHGPWYVPTSQSDCGDLRVSLLPEFECEVKEPCAAKG